MKRLHGSAAFLALALTLAACGDDDDAATPDGGMTDEQYAADVVEGMRTALADDLEQLATASADVCAAAPTPADRGWDAELDAAAIADMKAAWIEARSGYERTEGALAAIFPDVDFSIDARYDDFLAELGPDADPFDGTGVTGLHAVERILYSDTVPQTVLTFEATLDGYTVPAYPATAAEAAEFKTGLCNKMSEDALLLETQWASAESYDIGAAFQGLIGLMNEQKEKVNKAATSEEESRYSQRTMADLRDNLIGAKNAYATFKVWLVSKDGGADIDAEIEAGFDDLAALYDEVDGAFIPAVPETWSAENPSAEDLATPFGKLYSGVRAAVDPETEGSIVHEMTHAAELLGLE